jgi:hypothetical protein
MGQIDRRDATDGEHTLIRVGTSAPVLTDC